MHHVLPNVPAPSQVWNLLRQAYKEWSEDHASRLAASLAFYTLLSIAPVVVLSLLVAGLAYGEDAARGQITKELANVFGKSGSEAVRAIVEHAPSPKGGLIGTTLGVIVLISGASGVFYELRASMHEIWNVEPQPHKGLFDFLRQHAVAFALVMLIALLLLISTITSALLSAVGRFGSSLLPGGEFIWQLINFGISLAIICALFALMYKYLAPIRVSFRDALAGGALSALLFVIGKSLIGLYLGKSSLSTSFGAAGSLVALLVWVYYSAQIVFFGAEVTQVLSRRHEAAIPGAAHT